MASSKRCSCPFPFQASRDWVDLDSADWLNFLVAVHEKLGVDIPDTEAAKLRTLDHLVAYCAAAT
jgi:acyl carrier protein